MGASQAENLFWLWASAFTPRIRALQGDGLRRVTLNDVLWNTVLLADAHSWDFTLADELPHPLRRRFETVLSMVCPQITSTDVDDFISLLPFQALHDLLALVGYIVHPEP
jgi:hypothetical protein